MLVHMLFECFPHRPPPWQDEEPLSAIFLRHRTLPSRSIYSTAAPSLDVSDHICTSRVGVHRLEYFPTLTTATFHLVWMMPFVGQFDELAHSPLPSICFVQLPCPVSLQNGESPLWQVVTTICRLFHLLSALHGREHTLQPPQRQIELVSRGMYAAEKCFWFFLEW